jgi:hypothetical protein
MTKAFPLLSPAQDWLSQHQAQFNPLDWTEKKAAYTRRKAFAELAIYAYVLGEDADAAMIGFLCDIANDPDYHALLLRNPRHLLLYSAPIALAIAHDRASPQTLACLDAALARPQVWAVERSPHRLMDLWQFLTVARRCPDWLDPAAVLATSALSHVPTPFDCTLSEAYALTHDVLFLKNFGVADPAFDTAPNLPMDAETTALTIARFMAEGNSDVVLELVMCLGLTGQLHKADLALVMGWIESRNAGRPYVSGPDFDPDEALSLSGLDTEWVANYHTTLVACSLMVLADRHGWTHASKAPRLLGDDLAELLHWGEAISALNRYEIPKALALVDSADTNGPMAQLCLAHVSRHLDAISDPATGLIGYWSDEMAAAARRDGALTLVRDLRDTATLAGQVMTEAGVPLRALCA